MTQNPNRDDDQAPSAPAHRYRLPLALAVTAAILLAAGIVPRLAAGQGGAAQPGQDLPTVSVLHATPAPAVQDLLLPGTTAPFADAAVYARTSGYIKRWNVDIGTPVKRDRVLATIQTPELDAQLRQAKADLRTAQAAYALARSTSDRWQAMLQTSSVAPQDAETRLADAQAKQAAVASAEANVQRLAELVSYEALRAPFDGVVTARNVDVGTLVNAAGAAGQESGAGELFHVQQVDRLRVFAAVPQGAADAVGADTEVYVSTARFPQQHVAATVARNAGAIDPVSRTLRVEVDVDNRDHALLPGAYVQVHFALRSPQPALELPVSAVLFRPEGPTIVALDTNGRTVLKRVTLGRDFGTRIEIAAGVSAADRIVDNPGDSITAGQPVRVASMAPAS